MPFGISAFARIENHYFINEVPPLTPHRMTLNVCFPQGFMREGQLLEKQSIDKMYAFTFIQLSMRLTSDSSRHIPCIVIQGRYDVVCPVSR